MRSGACCYAIQYAELDSRACFQTSRVYSTFHQNRNVISECCFVLLAQAASRTVKWVTPPAKVGMHGKLALQCGVST